MIKTILKMIIVKKINETNKSPDISVLRNSENITNDKTPKYNHLNKDYSKITNLSKNSSKMRDNIPIENDNINPNLKFN